MPVLLAGMSVWACDKVRNQETCMSDGCRYPLKVEVCGEGTKLTDISQEEKINTMRVYVFRSDGTLDAQGLKVDGNSLTLSCTTLAKKVYVLVNAEPSGRILTETDFTGMATDLADNSAGNFVMTGSSEVSLPTDTGITVNVQRIACRVVIKELVRDFVSEAYRDAPFRITDIYIKDAPGNTDYAAGAAPSKFYNAGKFSIDTGVDILGDAPGLTLESPDRTCRYYYCYPRTADAPKRTRLVLKTVIGSDEKVYYYPIDLPEKMDRNVSYEFPRITITRPGSDDPESPIATDAVDFTLNIVPWTDTVLPDETI